MNRKLVILRGAPCSGKTTIAENLRDYDKRIVWLSVDKVKPIFSDFKDETLDEANKTAMTVLSDLLDRDFSVVFDGIFKKPEHLQETLQIAKSRDIPVIIYQLNCSLSTLLERDKTRNGVKHGLWKPLGEELIAGLLKKVEENPIKGAIPLDTEALTLDDCFEEVKKSFEQ